MRNQRYTVAAIVGSLRRDSFTRKLTEHLMTYDSGLDWKPIAIGDLPLYNEDLEKAPPAEWRTFRDAVHAVDGVLFATPEYNRSMPGCLKNALDVGSRPYGQSAWDGKPAAVVSVSPGALGAFGANHHLRQSMVFLNMPALQQPEAYVGNAQTLLAPGGGLTNSDTDEFLRSFISAFGVWIRTHVPAKDAAVRKAS
jgi:chromate reductase